MRIQIADTTKIVVGTIRKKVNNTTRSHKIPMRQGLIVAYHTIRCQFFQFEHNKLRASFCTHIPERGADLFLSTCIRHNTRSTTRESIKNMLVCENEADIDFPLGEWDFHSAVSVFHWLADVSPVFLVYKLTWKLLGQRGGFRPACRLIFIRAK